MPLACVLISDITGSTQIYEREDNETALGYMLPVLERMRELISSNDGICVKSKGDDTISFFPTSENAFNAAWAMINEEWHLGMSVHAGIYFGEVLRQDAGLYGSAVNTAARLASLAKPSEVLVGANCIDGLSDDNRARVLPIGDLHLKGKEEPTQVFAASVHSMAATTMVFAKRQIERPSRTELVELTYGGQSWRINEGEKLTIGRSSDCDIVVDCAWVSRRHGEISIRQWQLEYADHSSAGSIVKGADGGEMSVHRRSTMLNGAGTIMLGAHGMVDDSCTIGFVAHDMSILAANT
ncbi:MAG: adenylate/guanylate cyclase domain-containing protein [Heliomarina sp.]|uniref:adenylate/guanylate cyclase domain-containing protein n=1 Tax=Heliomarina sp. TaxID=2917556 RepID=UPI0040589B68